MTAKAQRTVTVSAPCMPGVKGQTRSSDGPSGCQPCARGGRGYSNMESMRESLLASRLRGLRLRR